MNQAITDALKTPNKKIQTLESRLDEISGNLVKDPKEVHLDKSQIAEAVKFQIMENEQIEGKKLNLIISNLDVPEDPETDESNVNKLIEEALDLEIKIQECIRFGTYTPKLLRVTLNNIDDKKKILSKATTLRGNDNYKDVYIRPDLTKAQREQSKKLSARLREIRERNKDKVFKISKGQIIEVTESDS